MVWAGGGVWDPAQKPFKVGERFLMDAVARSTLQEMGYAGFKLVWVTA